MKQLLFFISTILIIASCKKGNDNPATPTIPRPELTTIINTVASRLATIDIVISNYGGATITEQGVTYSTASNSANPTNISVSGSVSPVGTFTITIPNLIPNTHYYVRAYAINSLGTTYGNEIDFTTAGIANLDSIRIGTQVWMAKNLNVTTYTNGDAIPQVQLSTVWPGLTTGACCNWQNQAAYGDTYGKLYNWFAVTDPRGLAPEGWHIPTDDEWATLVNYLGGAAVAGGKMKEIGLTHWKTPNTGGDNSSGFTALPGSARSGDIDGNFIYGIGETGIWWTASEQNFNGICRYINFDNASVFTGNIYKQAGYSIRCIKD